MTRSEVYLEIGAKRVFACAVAWPGWCRSGSDEAAALEALLEYGPRYAAVVRSARLGFEPPTRVEELRVVERIEGNATTDFGAPGVIPSADHAAATESDCSRFEKVLRAGWRALDAARQRAAGKALRTGPRGGGRELEAIVRHVVDSDRGYLNALGWKIRPSGESTDRVAETRQAIIEGLHASARGDIPATGPRGGARWPVRYFVRRVAWHVIAHAWEIERRVVSGPLRILVFTAACLGVNDARAAAQAPGISPAPRVTNLAGARDRPGLFTQRLVLPAGFCGPIHVHDRELHGLVLRGILLMGIADSAGTLDVHEYPRGSFVVVPARRPHVEGSPVETEIHLSGFGPVGTVVVDSLASGRCNPRQGN